ncbi:uncharacterized protein LOC143292985 isoform X3 [Babylonia areolata]|uniref:uncharacterized protein LOC143292985 isoform X3 n=1 Tax=Babylonia areolata TaxID=304850 RepID=UPI003FD0B0B1
MHLHQREDIVTMVMRPSIQDRDTIFQLAHHSHHPHHLTQLHNKLQTVNFNVNSDCDSNGDFLLHALCRKGLSQVSLVMSLVQTDGADVELCNSAGFTPLMLAALCGNPVLCDVLVCLLGADVNRKNPHTGRTALHCAVKGNHSKTAECLIRRGADVNVEDGCGRRADDLALSEGVRGQCVTVVHLYRAQRVHTLCELTQKGELERHHVLPTDVCEVNGEGHTLVMTAAIHNRCAVLEMLLTMDMSTIDAQHVKTGMTALSMAAQLDNAEAVAVLLKHGASAAIRDMKSYLPLQYAVRKNHERVVDVMLQHFPQCYTGFLMASRLCRKTSIHLKLKAAMTRRQEEVVTPALMACAVNGNAEHLYQLLEEGDDVDVKSDTGSWPLYLAVENGHVDVITLLCQHGGDVRRRHSNTGETILHVAARMGHTRVTRYLLGYCRQAFPHNALPCPSLRLMDINVTDFHNRTPLQAAADRGYSQVVEVLLSHGASAAVLDSQGQLMNCPQYQGVSTLLFSHRYTHTHLVTSLLCSHSRKDFEQLQKMWVPRFDHNLRTRQGDTPLMTACSEGNLQAVLFLLQCAVFPQPSPHRPRHDDSDADSGVLEHTAGSLTAPDTPVKTSDGEESQDSVGMSQSTECAPRPAVSSGHLSQCLTTRPDAQTASQQTSPVPSVSGIAQSTSRTDRPLHTLLQDVSRPKGLAIFHADGVVSHVCAVSHGDGSTALHRAVQQGDSTHMARALLTADPSCVNLQNDAGLSPLHLACQLGRKRITQLLLSTEGVDVNARTLDSLLPEEMTTSKRTIRLVQRARLLTTGRSSPPCVPSERGSRRDERRVGTSTGSAPSHPMDMLLDGLRTLLPSHHTPLPALT